MAAATTRSGKPRRSSAIDALGDLDEAVADLALARPHRQRRAAAGARRGARGCVSGASAISTRSGAVLEHAVAGGGGAHGCVFHGAAARRGDQVVNGRPRCVGGAARRNSSPREGGSAGRGRASTRTASVCVRFPDTNRSSSGVAHSPGSARASTAADSLPSMRQFAPRGAAQRPRQTAHRHVHSPITPSSRALHRNRCFPGESAQAR